MDAESGTPRERLAATSRAAAVIRAARGRRPPLALRPALLFSLAVVLLGVSFWVDVTDRSVPDGYVRATGEVTDVRHRDCGPLDRGCDPETYVVAWTDLDGRQRSTVFEVGGYAVGDRVELRYRPSGDPRPQQIDAYGPTVLLLRLGAVAAFAVGAVVGLLTWRR